MSKPDTWMPLYIGDYIADTMHLNTEQHGAYLLLLMTAWNRGGVLPADENQLSLICRADKKAWARIRGVVLEFFKREGDKLIQPRLVSEYERAVVINAKQKANGSKGGRPKKTQTETQEKPTGFVSDNHSANPNETPSPSPSQTPKNPIAHAYGISTVGTPAGEVCARLMKLGIQALTPQHPKLLALLNAGLTVEEIVAVGPEAKEKGKGFMWLLATAEGRRRDAAAVEKLPKVQEKPWFILASGIEAKAAELGITKGRDEVFPVFKTRVLTQAGVTEDMLRRANIDFGNRP